MDVFVMFVIIINGSHFYKYIQSVCICCICQIQKYRFYWNSCWSNFLTQRKYFHVSLLKRGKWCCAAIGYILVVLSIKDQRWSKESQRRRRPCHCSCRRWAACWFDCNRKQRTGYNKKNRDGKCQWLRHAPFNCASLRLQTLNLFLRNACTVYIIMLIHLGKCLHVKALNHNLLSVLKHGFKGIFALANMSNGYTHNWNGSIFFYRDKVN